MNLIGTCVISIPEYGSEYMCSLPLHKEVNKFINKINDNFL
jgi:hypothetical protein